MARIKLITLPIREKVEIQLQNQDTTLIEEERIVPLKKGINDIDFAWQNTSIRAETIIFRVLEENSDLKTNVLSVSYPPNESALTWQVSSNRNASARVKITYAINHLDKKYHYLALANHDETKLDLTQFIQVINSSGEEYQKALINTGIKKKPLLDLRLNESQEFSNHKFTSIPIVKNYSVNAATWGYRSRANDKLNVYMHYLINNDEQHQLGQYPLSKGKVRLYQKDKNGTKVFLGEDWASYTSQDEQAKLYIGDARDVVVKRIIESNKRQRINGNLYDQDVVIKYEIENFKDHPIELIVEESLPYLRNEVIHSRRHDINNQNIAWQLGKQTTFNNKPIKKLTNSQLIAYKVLLPARHKDGQLIKLNKQLNINFKNEW